MNNTSQVINYKFDINAFDKETYSRAIYIVNKLKEKGHAAYFVGGAVRDVLMGLKPTEIDISTSASPDFVMKTFEKVHLIGLKFGVCTVEVEGQNFEVSTFRKDLDYKDGRHPEKVVFSNPQEDALRRDFTINALFWEPIESKLYDYVGGLLDIHNGVIRCVGDPFERFKEDKLRILRCARFVSQLSFNIDINTVNAIKTINEPFTGISMERIRDEFNKALITKNPSYMFIFLEKFGLLRKILPEISNLVGVKQPKKYHPEGDVWTHTMMCLDLAAKEYADKDLEFMWAMLLHDAGKPSTANNVKELEDKITFYGHDVEGEKITIDILKRFKMPNKFIKNVSHIVKNHMTVGIANKMKKSKLKLLMAEPTFLNELKLLYIDSKSSNGDVSLWHYLNEQYEEFKKELELPKAIVDGNFLIDLGLKPSKSFSEIIKNAYEAQLEGVFKNKTGAKKFINNILNKK